MKRTAMMILLSLLACSSEQRAELPPLPTAPTSAEVRLSILADDPSRDHYPGWAYLEIWRPVELRYRGLVDVRQGDEYRTLTIGREDVRLIPIRVACDGSVGLVEAAQRASAYPWVNTLWSTSASTSQRFDPPTDCEGAP